MYNIFICKTFAQQQMENERPALAEMAGAKGGRIWNKISCL